MAGLEDDRRRALAPAADRHLGLLLADHEAVVDSRKCLQIAERPDQDSNLGPTP
jgi:hypothetical protein